MNEQMLAYQNRQVNSGTMWILFLFLGWSYGSLGKMGLQILYYITAGGFGIWTLIRLFTLSGDINEYNRRIAHEVGLSPEQMRMMGFAPLEFAGTGHNPEPEVKKEVKPEPKPEPKPEVKEEVKEKTASRNKTKPMIFALLGVIVVVVIMAFSGVVTRTSYTSTEKSSYGTEDQEMLIYIHYKNGVALETAKENIKSHWSQYKVTDNQIESFYNSQ